MTSLIAKIIFPVMSFASEGGGHSHGEGGETEDAENRFHGRSGCERGRNRQRVPGQRNAPRDRGPARPAGSEFSSRPDIGGDAEGTGAVNAVVKP